MAFLYKNSSGFEVKSHSHSGGIDWACPKKYYWKRLEGWQSKEEGCALAFGKCVEAAIQYFHIRNFDTGSGVDEFKKLWWAQKDNEELTYTEKSGNWDDHYRMGTELLGLYEMSLPDLPVANAEFQVTVTKKLFESGEYEGLRYKAILDMICTAPSNHPLLPPTTSSEPLRKFIVDIKTSATSYYTDPRLSSLDDQLRDYAWITGLSTVAFLVLVKNHTEIGSGDWITVLSGPKAGKKYQAFDNDGSRVLCLTKDLYEEYMSRKKSIKGKGAKEAQEVLLTEYFYKGLSFPRDTITKQRIQFLPAIISDEDAAESMREAIHEAMDIANHSKDNYFPKHPGVRFPHNPCTSCECLGLCIGDKEMVKEKLIQIGAEF